MTAHAVPLLRCLAAATLGWSSAASLLAAPPELSSFSPRTWRTGQTQEVVFRGRSLEGAETIWSTLPIQSSRVVSTASNQVHLQIIPVQAGLGLLRLFGNHGVSAGKFVLADDLPTGLEATTNRTRALAQPLRPGTALDGTAEESGYDWFKVRLEKGQRLAVEVVASRLGSKLDSVLRLFDANGKQLAQNDDGPGLPGDSFLTYQAPRTAEYFLELRDVNYGGGPEYFYHLRAGSFTKGIDGWFAAASEAGEHPKVSERNQEQLQSKPVSLNLPGVIRGRFTKAQQRDTYELRARTSDRLEFRAFTRSLGSPCDAVLELASPDGTILARSNPGTADEGILVHTFAADGSYRLSVSELTGGFGGHLAYRVEMDRAAGFALNVETDTLTARPEEVLEVKVIATRTEEKGPITLALAGLREAAGLSNQVIAAGQTNTTLRISLPAGLSPATPRFFRITGQAGGTNAAKKVASTAAAWRRNYPLLQYAPPGLDGTIALGIENIQRKP